MKTINSLSGGKSSSYIAAHWPADHEVFAVVCCNDPNCAPKDPAIKQYADQKFSESYTIDQGEFIATLEDDQTLVAMMELEQFIGRSIDWVRGISFDQVVKDKGGWLPNALHRYCTSNMKIEPLFEYWFRKVGEPVEMRIGYRANETRRINKMCDKMNQSYCLEHKVPVSSSIKSGRRKWESIAWQLPTFPLYTHAIFKDHIETFWKGKPVHFPPLNNCVGCFHRNPILLRKMFDAHPDKMNWFANQEGGGEMGIGGKMSHIAKSKTIKCRWNYLLMIFQNVTVDSVHLKF